MAAHGRRQPHSSGVAPLLLALALLCTRVNAQLPNFWGPAPPPPDPWSPSSGGGGVNPYVTCATVWQLLQSLPNMAATRAALTGAGLVSTLNDPNFAGTVFAPVDQAWGSRPLWWWNAPYISPVLLYHILPGAALSPSQLAGRSIQTAAGAAYGTLSFTWQWSYTGWSTSIVGATNSAVVLTANITACNQGVVHTISNVLVPNLTPAGSPPPPPPSPWAGCSTLYSIIGSTPQLSMLKAYVDRVYSPGGLSLAAVLNDPLTRTTLLAPNNQAFQYLVAPWWANNLQQLAQVLTYHLISGDGRTVAQLVNPAGQLFSTASNVGGSLTASFTYQSVAIKGLTNSARITQGDILACSGSYVQIVDTVLMPF